MKERFTKAEKHWIMYDVGNSAFTLLVTAIMPIYFSSLTGKVGMSAVDTTSTWAFLASIVTLSVALIGPFLGTLTDFKGFRKPIFATFMALGVLGCAVFSIPTHWIAFAIIFVMAKIGFSGSLIFYDSMLPDITTPNRMDSVSANGYAWGYIGSCIPFIISIVIILFTPLSATISMPIAFIINAVWWAVFTLPLLKTYRQVNYVEREKNVFSHSIKRLAGVFKEIKKDKGILLFLIAFFLYIDAVYTIINMAASFATAIGLGDQTILIALLVTQFVAFPFAILFGKLAGKYRNDKLILVCIIAYTAVAIFALQLDQAWEFWLLAVCVGMFQGGVQALSRSYFAKIIPAERSGEYFGIFDIFGKGADVLGTLLFGVVAKATNNANMGILPVAVLLVMGLVVFIFAIKANEKKAI